MSYQNKSNINIKISQPHTVDFYEVSMPVMHASPPCNSQTIPQDQYRCSPYQKNPNNSGRQRIASIRQQELIQSRLSKNIQSLNKLSRSLVRSRQSSRRSSDSTVKEKTVNLRSKSTSVFAVNNSKVKHIDKMAAKLESGEENRVKDQNGKGKERINKLNILLKDVKKLNKESSKVVYTIKKTRRKSPRKEVQNYHGSKQSVEIKNLAEELSKLKEDLLFTKKQNSRLLAVSEFKSDNESQESRITRQKYNFDEDVDQDQKSVNGDRQAFNGSQQARWQGQNLQRCFACGCTCGHQRTLRQRINF